MKPTFDTRRWLIASLVVFVVVGFVEVLAHKVILADTYLQTILKDNWMWPVGDTTGVKYQVAGYILLSFILGFIFARGYEGKPGLGEGIRFGLQMGVLAFVPRAFIDHGLFQWPKILLFSWMLTGIIECALAGLVLGLLYRPKART